MSLLRLSVVVVALAGAIGLALSNPTMDDYLRFVEQELSKAIDRMDQGTPTREQQFIRQVFQSQSKKLLESIVRPNTARQNWGIASRYETAGGGYKSRRSRSRRSVHSPSRCRGSDAENRTNGLLKRKRARVIWRGLNSTGYFCG